MNILVLNPILFTADNNIIPKVNSIKDCMIYSMCIGFKEAGHNVTLIAAQEYRPVIDEVYDFEVIFFPSKFRRLLPPSVLPMLSGLRNYIRKNSDRFDLIVSSETFSFSSLYASRRAARKTVIWQELAGHNNKMRKIPSRIWYNVIAKLWMRKALVIPRSGRAKEFISQYMMNVSAEWVDHGVNLFKFKYGEAKKRQVIVVSQLIARKNVASILGVFATFVKGEQRYADFKLLIAGRGEEEPALGKLVGELKIEGSVEFLGFLPHTELNKHISESQASLIKTKKDLNIVSIPESIVCGTPVLSNRVTSLADFINTHKLGIARDNWDAEDLKKIIDNNGGYVRNCIAIRNEMSNESAARKMINLFQTMAQ